MSGHNNVFDTLCIRPWNQPTSLNSMAITTPAPATDYPIGLTVVALGHRASIRITSYFDGVKFVESNNTYSATIHLDSCSDSTLYHAACTWLPTYNPDREFQYGRVLVKPDQLIHGITFGREFASLPKVIVWLSGFDVDKDTNWQFRAIASGVTTKGFTLKGEVWGNTRLHQMEATWIAYPSSRSNIDSGEFTVEAPSGQQLQHQNPKPVTFGKHFDQAPRVYFALNRIDTTNETCMRFRTRVGDVTTGGMTLYLETWCDSRLHSAEGQWVAIQDL